MTVTQFLLALGVSLCVVTVCRGAVSEPFCESYGYTITCYNLQSDSYDYVYQFMLDFEPGVYTTPYYTEQTEQTEQTDRWYSENTDYTTDYYTGWYDEQIENKPVNPADKLIAPPKDTAVTLRIYDSMVSDLPTNTFNGVVDDVIHVIFANCSFRLFPFPALTMFNYLETIEVTSSYIASFSATYMNDQQYAYSLQEVSITSSFLADIPSDAFNYLYDIERIILNGNKIATIQDQAFATMSYLKMIDLSDNRIQSIGFNAFYDLPALTTLYLHDNNLMTFTNNSFDRQEVPQLSQLTVAGNPFICNCDLQWLKAYLDQYILNDDGPSCVCPQSESFDDVDFCGWD